MSRPDLRTAESSNLCRPPRRGLREQLTVTAYGRAGPMPGYVAIVAWSNWPDRARLPEHAIHWDYSGAGRPRRTAVPAILPARRKSGLADTQAEPRPRVSPNLPYYGAADQAADGAAACRRARPPSWWRRCRCRLAAAMPDDRHLLSNPKPSWRDPRPEAAAYRDQTEVALQRRSAPRWQIPKRRHSPAGTARAAARPPRPGRGRRARERERAPERDGYCSENRSAPRGSSRSEKPLCRSGK